MLPTRMVTSPSGKPSTQRPADNEPNRKPLVSLGCLKIQSAPQRIESLLAAFETPANDLETGNPEHEDFSDIVRTRLLKLGVL